MRAVELARAGGPEALTWIVGAPQVEVEDLRPLDRREAHHAAGRCRPRVALADADEMRVNEAARVRRTSDRAVDRGIRGERAADARHVARLRTHDREWWHDRPYWRPCRYT